MGRQMLWAKPQRTLTIRRNNVSEIEEDSSVIEINALIRFTYPNAPAIAPAQGPAIRSPREYGNITTIHIAMPKDTQEVVIPATSLLKLAVMPSITPPSTPTTTPIAILRLHLRVRHPSARPPARPPATPIDELYTA